MIDALLRFVTWLLGPKTTGNIGEPALLVAAYRLHVPRALLQTLRRIATPRPGRVEPLAFLRVRFASEESRTVLVGIGVIPFPEEAYVEGHAGANFDSDFAVDVANREIPENVGLLLVHSHGGNGMPRFSGIDNWTNREIMGGLATGIDIAPYGALVLSNTDGHCVVSVAGEMVDVKVVPVPDQLGEFSVTA